MLIAGLASLALLVRLAILSRHSASFFFNEEAMSQAVFGLMGKHILDGKPMVYMYGQGYMGSIESFLAAFFYQLRGMDILSLQYAVLTLYVLFIVANTVLLKKLFGTEVSLIANASLALSGPFLTRMSLYSYGGYNGTLLFGSLTLLALVRLKEDPSRKKWAFLAGFFAGVGFWTHNLILMYFFSAAVFLFLTNGAWTRLGPGVSWKRPILLEGLSVPRLWRSVAVLLNLGVLFFIVWSLVSFLAGPQTWKIGGLELGTFSLPFRVKDLKKVLLLLFLESAALFLYFRGLRALLPELKRLVPFLGGFLLGEAPVLYYSLFDDSGYRQIHTSGMTFASQLPELWNKVMGSALLTHILDIPRDFWTLGLGGMAMPALFLGLLLVYLFSIRDELKNLLRRSPGPYSFRLFPLVMTVVVLGICLLNNVGSTAPRYLVPLYFAFSLAFALAISHVGKRSRLAGALLFSALLAGNVYADARFLNALPPVTRDRDYRALLARLEERGIRGAYAHCDLGYPLTFLGKERILVAAYRSVNRIPWYNTVVDGLPRVAYIFNGADPFTAAFEEALRPHGLLAEKVPSGEFMLFIVDRSARSELGLVPSEDA